jgi:hypothetical protein
MSANNRLKSVQESLEKHGVHDVKFFFDLRLPAIPSSEVGNGAADFLDAYLKGRSKSVDRIGDSAQV